MIGAQVVAALGRLRAQAESLMVDQVTITRPGATTTDPATGEVSTASETVYTGKARWRPATTAASESMVGTATVTTSAGSVHIPAGGTYSPQPGDIITCTAAAFDTSLVGQTTTVRSRFSGSLVTAYRIPVEEA